ncbi:energy-coupling factor transporter transmembrane protein EcfT [Rhodococcus sp. BP-349]|uniref:energy-coupling factor transporter transmembrane component T family protein n=1 Tax=unclassified Rhodococcus (in: high G+C Gram-positive bacteria) TaxID=192944 RepID=UPI001C9B6A84|nr:MULTISPECIES: energy-coupling factor transporter transmembrane protein EcfT [unclassified Rhodococcus (in: high G+C Gram-positive bacteria)]MBY6538560.1 energy-coupling factor transporter transmembrane protein EcfT [Rhodococcus sp. BP-363]MBY6542897.1 energy-coupling factor transporter transmembrane protein EcfT [Rhodococcus sp. BP-369]MBY6562127.1 energy-coupling factor transporter transmembrane protein EcfT [Rhodococcus sp. BP-370]MBY6576419.1 energy-coupling factor transporter transmembra
MIGLYRPGHSLLHRLPAGWKLLLLMVGVIAVIALVRRPVDVAVAAGVVAVLFGIGGIGPRTALAQIRPLFWMIAIIAVFQVIITTPARAVVVCGILVVTVAAASLVTLTTRVTAMLDVCGRVLEPLRRFGVDPDRIGLLLALTIRLVPLLTGIVHEVSDARKARGLQWSMTALATPVVVRALRTADALGDSLVARGVDDDRDEDT